MSAGPGPDGGRVAVVTGASRGLGSGLAAALSDRGWRLGLCARTTPAAPPGAVAVARPVDVADAEGLDAFAAEVVERFGRIDLWINNAGVLDPIGPLADAEPSALRRHLDTNVLGVLLGSRVFARHLRGRVGGGVLVNLSSGAGSRASEGWAAYCASKAAVDLATEVVGLEERAHGLRAYAVAPGLVDTDMQALIRSTPVEAFPSGDRFRRAYDEGAFNSPAWVADYLVGLVDDPGAAGGAVRLRVPDQTAGVRRDQNGEP
jgi:NAD(P)-dependent dehydrogenase (short-subunit alcohol dehydrogenase family)